MLMRLQSVAVSKNVSVTEENQDYSLIGWNLPPNNNFAIFIMKFICVSSDIE